MTIFHPNTTLQNFPLLFLIPSTFTYIHSENPGSELSVWLLICSFPQFIQVCCCWGPAPVGSRGTLRMNSIGE